MPDYSELDLRNMSMTEYINLRKQMGITDNRRSLFGVEPVSRDPDPLDRVNDMYRDEQGFIAYRTGSADSVPDRHYYTTAGQSAPGDPMFNPYSTKLQRWAYARQKYIQTIDPVEAEQWFEQMLDNVEADVDAYDEVAERDMKADKAAEERKHVQDR